MEGRVYISRHGGDVGVLPLVRGLVPGARMGARALLCFLSCFRLCAGNSNGPGAGMSWQACLVAGAVMVGLLLVLYGVMLAICAWRGPSKFKIDVTLRAVTRRSKGNE